MKIKQIVSIWLHQREVQAGIYVIIHVYSTGSFGPGCVSVVGV